jgi:hypothetical protein
MVGEHGLRGKADLETKFSLSFILWVIRWGKGRRE